MSALLFLVAGAMILINGEAITSGTNTNALYVTAVAGILAIIYAVDWVLEKRNTFQLVSGFLLIISGIVFAASAFVGSSMTTVLAAAGIIAFLAVLMDMLAKWQEKVFGAMYISAAFTAAVLAVSVLALVNGASVYYGLIPLVFGIWMVINIVVTVMISGNESVKTREVVSDKVSEKKEKQYANNNKGTKKAKSAPQAKKEAPKEEPKKAEPVKAQAKKEAPKKVETPKAEPAKEAPKAAPKETPKDTPKEIPKEVPAEPVKAEEPKEEPEPVAEETPAVEEPVEAPKEESKEEPVEEVPKETPAAEEPKEEPKEEPEPEQPVEETPAVEEPVVEEPVAEQPVEAPVEEPIEEPEPVAEETPAVEEPAEEVPVEAPREEPEPVKEEAPAAEEPIEEPEPVKAEEPVEAPKEESKEEPSEPVPAIEAEHDDDMYTDYSPEAVVRRAAWNKGLRCRRDYGDHNIPVAFVKGKVAVFVQPADADTSIDAVLKEEGWTVLRYDEAVITDGLKEGEEISAAVKANIREAKAASKKKKRTAKK